MEPLQIWLVSLLERDDPIEVFMRTAWGWPMMESLHFISLAMLVGAIGMFDLRLLGLGARIPVAAVRRLVPWGLAGFVGSVLTGATFMLTEPNQYIYNSAFLWKVVFIAVAGLNAGIFALSPYGKRLDPQQTPPVSARIIAVVSLAMWVSVMVAGRLITFYRPAVCPKGHEAVIATCIP